MLIVPVAWSPSVSNPPRLFPDEYCLSVEFVLATHVLWNPINVTPQQLSTVDVTEDVVGELVRVLVASKALMKLV